MEIEASDNGNPERVASLTLYVTVQRSTRAPRFDDTPYNAQRIAETKRVGEQVFRVKAHDPDLRVSESARATPMEQREADWF